MVLKKEESSITVKGDIEGMFVNAGDSLDGLMKSSERLYPGYVHDIPERVEMMLGGLIDGFIITNTCSDAK